MVLKLIIFVKGELNGKVGHFPFTHVEFIDRWVSKWNISPRNIFLHIFPMKYFTHVEFIDRWIHQIFPLRIFPQQIFPHTIFSHTNVSPMYSSLIDKSQIHVQQIHFFIDVRCFEKKFPRRLYRQVPQYLPQKNLSTAVSKPTGRAIWEPHCIANHYTIGSF